MKEVKYPTELFRKQLDGVLYTTAPSFLLTRAYLHSYTHAEGLEMEELAEVCPFCDDEDVQRQLEEVEKKGIHATRQEKGGKQDEIGREGKEE